MARKRTGRRFAELAIIVVVFGQISLPAGAQPAAGVSALRLGAARQIVHEAARLAGSIQDSKALGVLRTLATAQARAGDVAGALRSMAALPPGLPDTQNTIFAWQAIAVAQAAAGDLPAAMATLAQALPTQSRDDALGVIAFGLASHGDTAGALPITGLVADATARDRLLWTCSTTAAWTPTIRSSTWGPSVPAGRASPLPREREPGSRRRRRPGRR